MILAEGRAHVQDIEARAIERIRKREVRRQQNIEAITVEAAKALPAPDRVSSAPVHADWTTRFFEECADINDKEMQSLWARILAREVASPQSFSPKTLSVVRDLTKAEAELFTQVCRFAWRVEAREFGTTYSLAVPELQSEGALRFGALAHLDAMGLIAFTARGGTYFLGPLRDAQVNYFGKTTLLRSNDERQLRFGTVILTLAGKQLCPICSASASEDHRVATIERWKQDGWSVEDLPAPGPRDNFLAEL